MKGWRRRFFAPGSLIGDVQWRSRLTVGPIFASRPGCWRSHRIARCREAGHGMWSISYAEGCIQVLINDHAAARQCRSERRLMNLPNMIGELDRVVVPNEAFLLDG